MHAVFPLPEPNPAALCTVYQNAHRFEYLLSRTKHEPRRAMQADKEPIRSFDEHCPRTKQISDRNLPDIA